MARYVWCTDIHLDFINTAEQIEEFCAGLMRNDPTGVLITGDLSTAPQVVDHMAELARLIPKPIYFVLGNHDYYRGEIEQVRASIGALMTQHPSLHYLALESAVSLSPKTAIVGHDCWYDTQFGDVTKTNFMMSDWLLVKDLRPHLTDMQSLCATVKALAERGVAHIREGIRAAAKTHENVLVLAHYPGFAEAALDEGGKPSDEGGLPWFACKALGEMLLAEAKAHADNRFTVLAGHTHWPFEGKFADNLEVRVGGAIYGHPCACGDVEVV